MAKQKTEQKESLKVFTNPLYQGKHLVMIQDKVFSAKTGSEAAKIFKKVIKKYPNEKPTITYVPKEGSLIL